MSYTIQQIRSADRPQVPEYQYRVYKDDRFIATYWHDHRGDEHGIEFADGTKDEWPVGRVVDFIEGGGPQPLVLSARAVAYLNARLR